MRETLGDTDRLSCSDTASFLEKQVAEERTSSQERQRVQAHLTDCQQCRRLANWMSALPRHADEHAEEVFHNQLSSAYQTMMERRFVLQHKEQRGKIAMAIVAAAAVLVAVAMGQGWLESLLTTQKEVAQWGGLDCLPASPTEPVPGVMMTYCKNEEPGALIENGGEVRVSLRKGAVGMLVDPNRSSKHKVTVETPQGEVRVKGTVFTVQVDNDDTRVEVFRGVVEFVPAAENKDVLQVAAGMGADLRRHKVYELSASKTTSLQQVLTAEAVRQQVVERQDFPEKETIELNSGAMSATSEIRDIHEPTGLRSRPDSRGLPESTMMPPRSGPAKRAVPTIDNLIQEAHSCLIAHDWTCASSRYQGILRYYPKRPESTAALISLARIELRHLDMPAKALNHYRTYQKRAPKGPMAEEALFGIAETYRRLGKKNQEKETLRRFIEQYPGSSQMKRAHDRLRQLEID